MEEILKKIALPAFCILITLLAYADSVKQCEIQVEDSRKFIEGVNLREEQLNEELQPLIDRNKKLNEGAGLSAVGTVD